MTEEYTLSAEELIEKLFLLMEEYDKTTKTFSDVDSAFKKLDKMEKHVIKVLENNAGEGSEMRRNRIALSSARYKEWFEQWSTAQTAYLNIKGKREGLKERMNVTISALSFYKEMVKLAK